MTTGDILQETYSALSANKVRSSLTILGIVIGISSVIAMVAIGQGAKTSIQMSKNSHHIAIEGKKSVDPLVIARVHHKNIDGIIDGGTIIPEETSVVDLSQGTAVIIREGVGPVSFFRSN